MSNNKATEELHVSMKSVRQKILEFGQQLYGSCKFEMDVDFLEGDSTVANPGGTRVSLSLVHADQEYCNDIFHEVSLVTDGTEPMLITLCSLYFLLVNSLSKYTRKLDETLRNDIDADRVAFMKLQKKLEFAMPENPTKEDIAAIQKWIENVIEVQKELNSFFESSVRLEDIRRNNRMQLAALSEAVDKMEQTRSSFLCTEPIPC